MTDNHYHITFIQPHLWLVGCSQRILFQENMHIFTSVVLLSLIVMVSVTQAFVIPYIQEYTESIQFVLHSHIWSTQTRVTWHATREAISPAGSASERTPSSTAAEGPSPLSGPNSSATHHKAAAQTLAHLIHQWIYEDAITRWEPVAWHLHNLYTVAM